MTRGRIISCLPYPPEPKVHSTVAADSQMPTPPPSPSRLGPPQRSPEGEFLHWGHMKPLNAHAPYKNWFFSRYRNIYKVGNSASADFRAADVPSMLEVQCVLSWDGTDGPDAVVIVDYSPPPLSEHFINGTFLNGERMEPGVPYFLRHGDELRIYPSPVMGAYEDLMYSPRMVAPALRTIQRIISPDKTVTVTAQRGLFPASVVAPIPML